MRNFVFVILCLWASLAAAAELEDRQTFHGENGVTLRVLSSTDTDIFAPILEGFIARNPSVSIDYAVAGSADIVTLIEDCPDCFDVVISSAMDLQLKLANDGLARRLPGLARSSDTQWRQSLFGFTLEPATMVLNRAAFEGRKMPTTRQELIEALRAEPERFRGRLGTYDVRLSGLGYLFATQDARTSETFWRLMEVFGNLDARLYCCSGDMIDDLASGELFVAYNVLGSYTQTRPETLDKVAVITPEDFATTMMRTALVLDTTELGETAAALVAYLTSGAWAAQDRPGFPLPSLRDAEAQMLSVVSLDPGLLVYLDRLKRALFLEAWASALLR
ncbi:substrate-binding domain-containing protein [Tateyamaria sp. ANG-S1]|uniref:ABC transporter substrate-binding protein n=1 Tax=Tateyamaria sp. ANG-S1 TaxID=1577905 RepID=UPI00057CDB34|nr:substrate-binding domain-containing protein [Tateyamaria sp. ANG-S1]KIC49872.1 ABC transporter substrate-binding protein [Tateyamaria sp. ANG-S1]